MCKGADSIMLPRCSFDHSPELGEIKKKTVADLHKFAVEGLRTLVMGQKSLSAREFERFASEFQRLKTSTEADKEAQLMQLYDSYERGLTYLGSTAVEDKLQDGVPETIAKLIETDIRVWVLTGDK